MEIEEIKKTLARKALEFVKSGMTIGLGSGSTASYFIDELIKRCKQGLKIHAIASSIQSHKKAEAGGIPLLNVKEVLSVDLTIDGADEVDDENQMIKGAGGALVREKILAAMSKEYLILIDETKKVSKLGKRPLPVEIIPFGCNATKQHLENQSYAGQWRKNKDQSLFVTDNHNYILDIHFSQLLTHPKKTDEAIKATPGVVDTGFFFEMADKILIGYVDGKVEIRKK